MDNLENEMQNVPELADDAQPPIPADVPRSRIIRPELLEEMVETDPLRQIPEAIAHPPQAPAESELKDDAPKEITGFLTPEEAAQLGLTDGAWEKVDAHGNAIADVEAKIAAGKAQKDAETLALFDGAIATENAHNKAIDQRLANPEDRKLMFGGSEQTAVATPQTTLPAGPSRPTRVEVASEAPAPEDLVPSYDYEDDDELPEAVEKTPEEQRPAVGEDEKYAKYIKELPIAELSLGDEVVVVSREKGGKVSSIPSGRKKARVMGDQAFDNSINKFKKDNFRIVDAPLVNSGIMASIVGTGAVDLALMYDNTSSGTNAAEYELDKMRIVIRSVVGTEPKIDKNDLRNMIHFVDYQIMAYAHMVATLSTVELVHTCDECGHDFRVKADSGDLLLNNKELTERMKQIKVTSKPDYLSLMARDRKVDSRDGFAVVVGHPSYAEYVQYLTELRSLTDQLSKAEASRLVQLAEALPYIRDIKLPDGTTASNLYQRYRAITMMDDPAFDLVTAQIKEMSKQIMYPKFGIKRVICPCCGKANVDIKYSGLNELLFFHIMVTRLLKPTD